MTEVSFYHLQRAALERALPRLLERGQLLEVAKAESKATVENLFSAVGYGKLSNGDVRPFVIEEFMEARANRGGGRQ